MVCMIVVKRRKYIVKGYSKLVKGRGRICRRKYIVKGYSKLVKGRGRIW